MSTNVAQSKCQNCGTEIPYANRDCVGCGFDVGFPNVRAADCDGEIKELQERVRYAQEAAKQRGCADELEAFGTAASDSQAVMVRSLSVLDSFVSNQNGAMVSYYKMVRNGSRIPENNEYDLNRGRIDATINPHGVHESLMFASLSLDGRGVRWYGDYAITLRDNMIEARSSVFEENPFTFCNKNPILSTGIISPGFRATWPRRAELAMAKLHPRIKPNMTVVDFPAVLVEHGTKSADSDFIEVHIYGVIHPRAVERVIGPEPSKRADKVIWKRVKRNLAALSAVVEVG
jgi:hypothetical protein